MNIEITKMSSKGQIVVPQNLRNELKMEEGSIFTIFGSKDTLILKKIKTPSKEKIIQDIENMAKEGRKRAEKIGLKESDIPHLVHKLRGIK
ncbi:MAG: AbrB/MazE/SpoVT family DNA-binding domain-containing protein [Nanoarchaeota archaeon]|nr:AbrB/MazE/SpoVT family DNA-binding domain-containing protein [Nanoarchaeota archaeon]